MNQMYTFKQKIVKHKSDGDVIVTLPIYVNCLRITLQRYLCFILKIFSSKTKYLKPSYILMFGWQKFLQNGPLNTCGRNRSYFLDYSLTRLPCMLQLKDLSIVLLSLSFEAKWLTYSSICLSLELSGVYQIRGISIRQGRVEIIRNRYYITHNHILFDIKLCIIYSNYGVISHTILTSCFYPVSTCLSLF